MFSTTLDNEKALIDVAAKIAILLKKQKKLDAMVIFLRGDLGAGKTTLVRGVLRTLGVNGTIKSPTYTLVEPYSIEGLSIFHMDWYRLQDENSLAEMGILENFQKEAIVLVEWPLEESHLIPHPDWVINIEILPLGRRLTINAHTNKGQVLLDEMVESL